MCPDERERDRTGQPLPDQDPFGALIFLFWRVAFSSSILIVAIGQKKIIIKHTTSRANEQRPSLVLLNDSVQACLYFNDVINAADQNVARPRSRFARQKGTKRERRGGDYLDCVNVCYSVCGARMRYVKASCDELVSHMSLLSLFHSDIGREAICVALSPSFAPLLPSFPSS